MFGLSVSSLKLSNSIESTGTATSTFSGGISTAGLSSSAGLSLTGGTILSSGIGTSTFSGGIQGTSLSGSNGISLTGGDITGTGIFRFTGTATSTLSGGLSTAGLSSSAGLTISAGSILNTSTATSTFSGGISATSLAGSNGLTLSGGDLSSVGIFRFTGTATSTISGGLSTAGLSSSAGLSLSGGTILSTGTATSTFSGGIQATSLAGSTGLTLSGGDFIHSGATFRLTSGGNVGIGTTSPSQTLSVAGKTIISTGISATTADSSADDLVIEGSGSTGITIFAGSANSAILAFGKNTDNTSGVIRYDNGGNEMRFNTNGSERLRISGGGAFGLGTTTPGGFLSVSTATSSPGFLMSYTGTGNAFIVEDVADDTSPFVIAGDGNVGIGTTGPGEKLHVVMGAGTVPTVSADSVALFQNNDDTSDLSRISILGGNAGFSVVEFSDADDADVGTIAYNHSTNALLFRTNAVSSRMIIDADGNVGIGTTGPQSRFHIQQDLNDAATATPGSAASYQMYLNGAAGTSGDTVGIAFGTVDGAATDVTGSIYAVDAGAGGIGDLAFATKNSNETVTEKMRILSSGNVGIGTTDPSQKLHVAGTARITTSVAVTDDRTLCTIAASGEIEFKDGACGTSSLRYKENIEGLDYGLEEINKLNPVFFNYIKDSSGASSLSMVGDRTKRKVGFIAEEVNEIIPEVVIWEEGQIDGIDYAYMTAVLAKAVQELDLKVSELGASDLGSNTAVFDISAIFSGIIDLFKNTYEIVFEKGILRVAHAITDRITTKELCVEDVCVTRDQFLQMVNLTAPVPELTVVETSPEPTPEPVSEEEPVVAETPTEEPISEPAPEESVPVEETSPSDEPIPESETVAEPAPTE